MLRDTEKEKKVEEEGATPSPPRKKWTCKKGGCVKLIAVMGEVAVAAEWSYDPKDWCYPVEWKE